MNILIVATHLKQTNGGVCTHILDLCKCFTKTDKVVLASDGTDYDDQIFSIPGLTYVELPFMTLEKEKKAIFSVFRKMKRLCKEHSIDIIHLHGQRLIPIAWMLRLTMGIPFLWTNHIDAIPQPELLVKMWRIMRFPIISVSVDLKNQLVDELGVDADKITVVNNGVDITTLEPLTDKEKDALRDRFGVIPNAFIISEVARLTHVKGQHLLVRAVHALSKKNTGIKIQVLFAGSGDMDWFRKEVLEYAELNGVECSYLGFCKPREVYGISHLAVLPSIFEGFSISSVEALMMGCPVLRSDTPGNTDMQGIVLSCEKGSLESLTVQLEYAISNMVEMQKMAAKGQAVVGHRFTKETMAQQTKAVYQRILGE